MSPETSHEARTDHAPRLEKIFGIDVQEASGETLPVEGEVPEWIRGSYYLNGPGRFRHGGREYRHWLDGDGLVTRLAFEGGEVRRWSRYVRSKKWTDEAEAGRALYRTFGTRWEGDELKRGIALESPVNVSVWRWRDALLAFGEQGLPWELDPATLETRGEYTFGGRLNAVSPLSAHPHFDPVTGEMFNFGISFAKKAPSLTLYRFLPDGELAARSRIRIPYAASVHDFMLAPRHVLFFLSPHVLDVDVVMKEGGSVQDALQWRPELGNRIVVAARESGEKLAEIELGPEELGGDEARYCLHLINARENARENGDHRLHLDLVELDRPVYEQYHPIPDLFADDPQGRAKRYVIDPEGWTVEETEEHPFTASMDFPAIDPRNVHRPYDDLWVLSMSKSGHPGRKFFDRVTRIEWPDGHESWQAPEGTYLGGEPVHLGHPTDPERGCVICQSFDSEAQSDAEAGAFLLFDAYDLEKGPVARLPLEHPLPLGFHASFQPEA